MTYIYINRYKLYFPSPVGDFQRNTRLEYIIEFIGTTYYHLKITSNIVPYINKRRPPKGIR